MARSVAAYLRRDRRSRVRARSDHPAGNDASEPVRCACPNRLAKLEARLVEGLDAHFRLKDKVDKLGGEYAHIVIDCPPALGLLTVNALVAATHLLIPIQSSYFALEGTDDLLETIEKGQAASEPRTSHPGRRARCTTSARRWPGTSASRFRRCLAVRSSAP